MQELPILRNQAGRAIRVMGVPDGQVHFALIQDGVVIRTKPIKGRTSMTMDFEDTIPTGPMSLDDHPVSGKHNYPPPDWELTWTKRCLFALIVLTVGLAVVSRFY